MQLYQYNKTSYATAERHVESWVSELMNLNYVKDIIVWQKLNCKKEKKQDLLIQDFHLESKEL